MYRGDEMWREGDIGIWSEKWSEGRGGLSGGEMERVGEEMEREGERDMG